MRACLYAQSAEHACAQIIMILLKTAFFLSVFGFICFCNNFYRPVRASHGAKPATYTVMLILFIMRHYERTAKTVEHLKFFSVFGILFGYLFCKKLPHGSFQAHAKGFHAPKQTFKITLILCHCNLSPLFIKSEVQTAPSVP